MTSEWKARQSTYHLLNPICEMKDDLSSKEIIMVPRESLLEDILAHFVSLPPVFKYPSKSYVVAIIYSHLLSVHFGGEFISYLDDAELLYNNDPHFVQYSGDKEMYDSILSTITLDPTSRPFRHIQEFFNEEFLINIIS